MVKRLGEDETLVALRRDFRTSLAIAADASSGAVATPFLPNQPAAATEGDIAGSAGPHQLMVKAPSRISTLFKRLRKLIPSSDTLRFSLTAAGTLSILSSAANWIGRPLYGAATGSSLGCDGLSIRDPA